MSGALKKPMLRGHVSRMLARNLFIAGVCGVGVAVAYKYMVALPRQRKYAEFYKTYDEDKAYARMKEAGLVRGFTVEED